MLCPFCREKDTSVVDSRPTEDGTAIRRRRVSHCCHGQRFTTFERVQFRELTIVKKNGRKSPFEREKLAKSIFISLKKRPVDSETIEKFISRISRNLEEMGQSDIPTSVIGRMVMDGLREIDKIAYIRFASVYTNFKEIEDFGQFVDKLDVNKPK